MPVDDDELKNMYQLVLDKLEINRGEETKLSQFYRACNLIKKVPSRTDPSVMNPVMDPSLGTEMSVSRRQVIYDKLLLDKVTLGL